MQVFSVLANGLAVVGVALSAYALQPQAAGLLLAAALFAKMLVYVLVAPVVGAFAQHLPRRAWLLGVNLLRAGCLLALYFVAQRWQLVVLVMAFYAFSAGFTPVVQALLPDILSDDQYIQALSWTRLLSELENLAAPAAAAALLLFVEHEQLFMIAAILMLCAAMVTGPLPNASVSQQVRGVRHQLGYGLRRYLATPRLQGLLALHAVVAFTGAIAIVNTVVLVRGHFGLDNHWLPLTSMALGLASVLGAWSVPWCLQRIETRTLILSGAGLCVLALLLGTSISGHLGVLGVWALIGAGMSVIITPAGRILIASCHPQDRNAYFAANFSLSHAMWLLGYSLAGVLGAYAPVQHWFWWHLPWVGVALCVALWRWPAQEAAAHWHQHEAQYHEHFHEHDVHHQHSHEGWEGPAPHRHPHHHEPMQHSHRLVLDEHHWHWPR